MKAKSSVYVELQNIYKTKARKDVAEVLETVRQHPNGSPTEIPNEEVEAFCKNAAFIKLIRASNPSPDLQELASKCHSISKKKKCIYIYINHKY